MTRMMFCPKCKMLKRLYSIDYDVVKFCEKCGCALYAVKEVNGTTVDYEVL